METPNCPDNDQLAAYLKGALPESQALAVEEHLSECDICEIAIRSLDHLSDTLRSAFREGTMESPPFTSDPQFRRAVDAICGLAEGKELRPQQSAQDADRSPPAQPRTLGEYEILQRLGSGGMGTVFKALHTRLNRFVALKMLREGRGEDAAASARFDREMRAVGTLDHPNIVRALDAREIDGTRFLVMELVEGMDLAELGREAGPLPIADACELIRQAALGLQSAHERGLVHRDIKPSNLMLTPQGQIKVLDLGLALFQVQPQTQTEMEMTASGQAVGTADYMAPEQVSDSHLVDIRADIYSLGGTLYKLLSGHAPFDSSQYRTQMEKMAAHLRDPIPPIRLERTDVPKTLAAILDRMLAKVPAKRYAAPGEVAAALAPFCTACDLPAVLSRAREGKLGKTADVNTEELCSSAMESTGASKPAVPLRNADRLSETAAHNPPSGRRRWRGPAVLAGILAAAAALVLLAVFLVRTRSGIVVIDADPPGAEISIDDGKITLVVPQVKEPIEIRLRPGEHAFEVRQGGFTTETGSFTLEAGGRKVLIVRLQELLPPAIGGADSPSGVRLPAVGRLVGADGKWNLPRGAPVPAVAPFDAAKAKEHQEGWAKYLGVPVEMTNSIGMKLVLIPPGEFMMGSPKELIEEELKRSDNDQWYKEHLPGEGPQHRVRITRPFYFGVYVVTQAEYQRIVGTNPSYFSATGPGKDKVTGQDPKQFPVEQVLWDEAVEFCRKLSEIPEEKAAGRVYQLPSEAQWEYACRAGNTGRYSFSMGGKAIPRQYDESGLSDYGWFNGNSDGRPHAVGGKRPNAWGLYDVHGNVWEWCQDWYDKEYYANSPTDDPAGPSGGSFRMHRGGGWGDPARHCRSAHRIRYGSQSRGDFALGFRASLVLPDTAAERAKMNRTTDVAPPSGGSTANKPSPGVASAESQSPARLPTVTSLVGADGKWNLPPGAPAPAVAPFDAAKAKEHQAGWAKYLGVPVEMTNSIGMKLVLIPPGEFLMGSPKELIDEELKRLDYDQWYKDRLAGERPQHRVRITRPFYFGVYLVTQQEYQRVTGTNPSEFSAAGRNKDKVTGQDTKRFPVDSVSWDDAVEFCRKLSELPEERATGRTYRLPSETQWEYACRAGNPGRFGFSLGGKAVSKEYEEHWLSDYGWFSGNPDRMTHRVGLKQPNAWELYDMHGNVWEWCQDWYDKEYYGNSPTDDPAGLSGGSNRVGRGGSWSNPAGCCRSAYRHDDGPGTRNDDLGFRAALVLADK